jgi:hypothetical protein
MDTFSPIFCSMCHTPFLFPDLHSIAFHHPPTLTPCIPTHHYHWTGPLETRIDNPFALSPAPLSPHASDSFIIYSHAFIPQKLVVCAPRRVQPARVSYRLQYCRPPYALIDCLSVLFLHIGAVWRGMHYRSSYLNPIQRKASMSGTVRPSCVANDTVRPPLVLVYVCLRSY